MLLVVLILCYAVLFANVTLNKYGHIERSESRSLEEYYIENGEYYIDIDRNTLIGNSLFEIENGYLTLITIEENVPTRLRIYDKTGDLNFERTFQKVINLTTSQNRKYTAFFDGERLQVLNNSTFQTEQFELSLIFDIDNQGNPIFADINGKIHYKNRIYDLPEFSQEIIFFQDKPLIFTSKKAFSIEDGLKEELNLSGNFFAAEVIDKELYFVEKNSENENYTFNLYRTNDLVNIEKKDEKILLRSVSRTHEPIFAPLNYAMPNYPFPVGNSYGEIQEYGGSPYLHPGVDFLGNDFQEVYAVNDGFVKAVLTTGGNAYWRVAVANEDIAAETEGYLYAHLNENSITVNVGDQVQAGDLLGTLYPWNYYDFTHIHFARLQDEGAQWYGNWWTIDNPHVDVTNLQDTIPPIFENALEDEKFAFRTTNGEYLDPLNLSHEFDIIAKCHDIENSEWRIDVWDIGFSLHPINDPDSTVYQQFSFAFDMPIDTYFSNYWTDIVLNTIYSRDATCYSIGNYDEREYYHVITNSNGDSFITEDDAAEIFDSSQFENGMYYLKVTARDASLNTTVDSMMVIFNNDVGAENDVPNQLISLSNYPNPFNPNTTMSFSLTAKDAKNAKIEVYNLKGQKVKVLDCINRVDANARDSRFTYSTVWDGTNENGYPVSSGVYFYKLKSGEIEISKKMLLLK